MINVKVVGTGCPNCQKLESLCREIIDEEDLEAEIEKITDVNNFVEHGIFMTPGLIINDNVKSSGQIPVKSTLKKWLTEAAVSG